MPEQPERNDRERTTIVTSGGSGGVAWFIVGAIVVALGAVWYFGSGTLDGTQTSDINVELPDVDVRVESSEPVRAEPAPAEPAPEQAPAPYD